MGANQSYYHIGYLPVSYHTFKKECKMTNIQIPESVKWQTRQQEFHFSLVKDKIYATDFWGDRHLVHQKQ
jgi:hypothetical protein